MKYEEVYLHDYSSVAQAKTGLKKYFNFYNFERHHQHFGYKKPAEIYFNKRIPVRYVNNVDTAVPAEKSPKSIVLGASSELGYEKEFYVASESLATQGINFSAGTADVDSSLRVPDKVTHIINMST